MIYKTGWKSAKKLQIKKKTMDWCDIEVKGKFDIAKDLDLIYVYLFGYFKYWNICSANEAYI